VGRRVLGRRSGATSSPGTRTRQPSGGCRRGPMRRRGPSSGEVEHGNRRSSL
jgi:hypothetical protein